MNHCYWSWQSPLSDTN